MFVLPYATGMPRNWRSLTLEVMGTLVALVVGLYARDIRRQQPAQDRRRPRRHAGQRRRRSPRLNTWAMPPPTAVPPASPVVDHDPDPRLLDDRAAHAAADAGRGARRRVDGSAGVLARLPARACRRRPPPRFSCWLAELRLRRRRDAAVARAAAARPPAARGAGARQLPAGRAARARAAWARSGAPSTGCWRATRRSSWCARRCSARAARPRRASLLRRFEREAQATAALSSPHTIQLFDFGVDRRRHVLLRDGAAGGPRPRVAGAGVRAGAGRPRASTCCARSATRWPTRTRAAWCTATSSRPTSTSAGWGSSTTSSRCSTSAW